MTEMIGGPDRDRTDDLFHAMEARSQLRHRPTLRVYILFCPAPPESSNASQRLPQQRPARLPSQTCSRLRRQSGHGYCY